MSSGTSKANGFNPLTQRLLRVPDTLESSVVLVGDQVHRQSRKVVHYLN